MGLIKNLLKGRITDEDESAQAGSGDPRDAEQKRLDDESAAATAATAAATTTTIL